VAEELHDFRVGRVPVDGVVALGVVVRGPHGWWFVKFSNPCKFCKGLFGFSCLVLKNNGTISGFIFFFKKSRSRRVCGKTALKPGITQLW
jgi:hypothetical protein